MSNIINQQTHSNYLNRIEILNLEVVYTDHATKQAEDRDILLPRKINVTKGSVVEATLNETGQIEKIVYRYVNYSRHKDLVMVLVPNATGGAVCKTVWLNLSTDQHTSLNLNNYNVNFKLKYSNN